MVTQRVSYALALAMVQLAACAGTPTPVAVQSTIAPSPIPPISTNLPSTARSVPPTFTPAPPTPTIIFNPHSSQVWDRIPNIVLATRKDDPRIPEAHQAVEFWNERLKSIGSPFRLGTVTESYDVNPDDLVPPAYRSVDPSSQAEPTFSEIPNIIASLHGEITIALTGYNLTSRTIFEWKGGQIVRGGRVAIFISNLPQNETGAFIHELGHALGLGHDNFPFSVMCAPLDSCGQRQVVLDEDQKFLLALYPPTWKPTR